MKKKLRTDFMLALILLLTSVMPMQAGDTLKSLKVTLDMSDATVKEVLHELEKQSQLNFFYSSDQINSDRRVKIKVVKSSLREVLDILFKNTSVVYQVRGSQILLIKGPEAINKLDQKDNSVQFYLEQTWAAEVADPVMMVKPVDFAIEGTVVDEDGVGLPGVNVLLKGSSIGTATASDGTYKLSIPKPQGVLVFSYIGYAPQEVDINNQSVINVSLVPDLQSLQEIVVMGYGEQKKADVTGATATVTTKDFNTGVINNPLQAIQGKVAGLTVTLPDGDPTSNRPIIRLRGVSSLNANTEPLVVIDGVVGASLNSVAPEDIEKYDVLKDASATAIYGSRGANGVIMVTTKKGKSGKTYVEYNQSWGFASPYKLPNVLSPDEYYNKLSELNPNTVDSGVRTDWFKKITRTAVSQNHNLSVSGGSENTTFRGSISYLSQPGIALSSQMDRLNARLSASTKAINDRLEFQINLAANQYKKDFSDNNAFTRAILYSPLDPVYNADGSYYTQNQNTFNIENPVAMLEVPTNEGTDKQLSGNVKLTFEIIDGLYASVSAAHNSNNWLQGEFTPKSFYDRLGETNRRTSSATRRTEAINDNLLEYTLSYSKDFADHSLNAVVGYSYQELSKEAFNLTVRDFPDLFTYNRLQAANGEVSNLDFGSEKVESKLIGTLARVNYSYLDKYLLTASVRRDGSSRFGANNRYGFFPAFSLGWKISEEAFMQNLAVVNALKLRAGYGITGNQNGIYEYAPLQLFGAEGKYPAPGGVFKTAYAYSQNANPDLQWETSATTNIGIDFGLFENRLTGSVEAYNKDTKNLLYRYEVSLGNVYGPNLIYVDDKFLANVGEMNNKGIEVSLSYLAVDKADFQWTTNFNIAFNKNKVVKLSGEGLTFPEEGIRSGIIYGGTNGYEQYAVLKEGLPVGAFYVPKEVGLNETGEPLYEVLDSLGAVTGTTNDRGQATFQYAGSPQPKFTLGWTNSLTYKNFDLAIFLRGSFGQKVLNGSNLVFNNPTTFSGIRPQNVYKTTFEGDNANLTKAGEVSDRYIEDGSFVRLDNVSLGYNVPLKSNYLSRLRFYVAAQNLLVITKYTGLDPEVRSGGFSNDIGGTDVDGNLAFGLDDFSFYPRARTFTVGLTAGF